MQAPLLTTDRLLLRAFSPDDAKEVQRLAGDPEVSNNLSDVPHPYTDGMAKQWIASHRSGWEAGTLACFAIVTNKNLVGAISLMDIINRQAELGYWIGRPYWGKGYCTEAVKEVVTFAFQILRLRRLYAHHLLSNPESGNVLLKAGFYSIAQGHVRWPKRDDPVAVELYECLR